MSSGFLVEPSTPLRGTLDDWPFNLWTTVPGSANQGKSDLKLVQSKIKLLLVSLLVNWLFFRLRFAVSC